MATGTVTKFNGTRDNLLVPASVNDVPGLLVAGMLTAWGVGARFAVAGLAAGRG
jgi:hypothetical protein